MRTDTGRIAASTTVNQGRDKSIETLQEILVCERSLSVSYGEAQELGNELLTFFEALSDGQEKDDKHGET